MWFWIFYRAKQDGAVLLVSINSGHASNVYQRQYGNIKEREGKVVFGLGCKRVYMEFRSVKGCIAQRPGLVETAAWEIKDGMQMCSNG